MIDASVIATLKESLGDDDGTIIGQLIELYASDSPQQLADAAAALEKSDTASLARAAHSLKSTSASMGAMTVARLASELEECAKRNDPAPSASLLAQLKSELSSAITKLTALKF